MTASARSERNDSPASPAPLEGSISTRLILLFAFIAATSPLATDLYLASFPDIQRSLGTSPTMVQLTLTAYLIGVAIGQPIWGPLSDRCGRRVPLLVSNALTVLSSLAVVVAPTIEMLIGARFLQALSAASGMVLARAMVSDLAHGYAGVRALSLMMTAHAVAPVIAPVLGGMLASVLPWRGVLAVFAAVVILQLVAAAAFVPETLARDRRTSRLRYAGLLVVMTRPAYVGYALTLALAMAAMMAYLTTSSFLYQHELGLSPMVFGLIFAVNAIGVAVAGMASASLARRHVHPARTVAAGLVGMLAGALMVLLTPAPQLVIGAIFIHAVSSGFVMGNCMGLAMEQSRDIPGAGSAVIGLMMFGLSAAVSPIPGLLDWPLTVALGTVMTLVVLAAFGSFIGGRAWLSRHPDAEAAFAEADGVVATSA